MLEREREYDEKHWYGFGGWRSLRAELLKIARSELPALLQDLSGEAPDVRGAVERFVVRMVEEMRPRQVKGASTKWMYAISLLGETDLLISMIEGDKLLNGNQDRRNTPLEAAFWEVFPRFLNRARQRQGATTEHRVAMWEQMDRLSRRIVAEHAKQGRYIDRLSTEHILEVQKRCLETWPDNKNINMELRTLRRYFEEFYEGSHEPLTDKNEGAVARTQSLVFDTQDSPAVRICLDRLLRHDESLWDTLLVKLGMHPVSALSAEAFALKQGVSRYEFDKRYLAAVTTIKRCIETSLDMLLRR